MAKFNEKKVQERVQSYEGTILYKRNTVEAWFNMLFSSFLENQYYEKSSDQIDRLLNLTEAVADQYDYAFVGKAAIFARNELGMRSVSQLIAAWLNDKSFQEKREFYRSFMRRPDDVSEIFGAVKYLDGKRSHALIKGSANYLSSLGQYEITKYKMIGHTYNMYDLINLTHANSKVINDFKNNLLKAPDTWEVSVAKKQSKESRQATWKEMVEEGKLGYMALLRNLNNILDNPNIDNEWIGEYLYPQLINENKIRKSLVFPYRIYTAHKNLKINNLLIEEALGRAFGIATYNIPKFDGINAIVLDVSGSMENYISSNSNITLKEIGACFATALFLNGSNIDFIKFGTDAKRFNNFSRLNNPFSIIDAMCSNSNCGWGTNIQSAIEIMKDTYDRIFVISDMQIFWTNYNSYYAGSRTDSIYNWNKRYGNIMTYSFDLANYDGQIEPPSDNFMFLTSLNDSIFKYIDLVNGKENIVNLINNISFG